MVANSTARRIIPAIVALAIFMEAVDSTIINTAIPVIARSLQVSVIDLKVCLISYLLSLALFIPISGWLADRFGSKRIFMGAVALFTVSSVWCGFANSLHELMLARFVQGIGGAFMLPIGRLIITRLVARNALISTMNRVIVPALIGPALGPLLGGVISESFSWRWIFWVNIPFGIMNLILAYYFMVNFIQDKNETFDWVGFILFGLGLVGLVFGLSILSEDSFPYYYAYIILAVAIILLLTYVYYALHCSAPVLKIKLLLVRTFRISLLGTLLVRTGCGGIPFLLPLLFQIPLGYSPRISGALVALSAVGAMMTKIFSTRVINYFGFKKVLIVNVTSVGLMLWLFMLIGYHTTVGIIAMLILLYGFMISLQWSTMNPLALADISNAESGAAISIMSVTQQVSFSFGVALAAFMLKNIDVLSMHRVILSLADFHRTLFVMGLIVMSAVILFRSLHKDDGAVLKR